MSALAFDPATHTYRHGGRLVPSVTQVLAPLYDFAGIPQAIFERKRALGVAVHKAIEFDLDGDLNDASIDERIAGYIAAWRRYRAERRYEHQHSERRILHPGYSYAGTLDLYGGALGKKNRPAKVLIDLKTTFDVHPAVALQTAAYQNALAAEEKDALKAERMALQLKPDGTYKEHWFEDPKDWPVFLSLLTVSNWAALNGLSLTRKESV